MIWDYMHHVMATSATESKTTKMTFMLCSCPYLVIEIQRFNVSKFKVCRHLNVCSQRTRVCRPFFYMAFACCVNVYMVSVHTSST